MEYLQLKQQYLRYIITPIDLCLGPGDAYPSSEPSICKRKQPNVTLLLKIKKKH